MRRHRSLVTVSVATGLLITLLAVVPALGADRWVTVEAGDTLGQIAVDQGVSIAQLVALNGLLDPDHIVPGQRLRVAVGPAATPSMTTPQPSTAADAPTVHLVRSGESAWGIARRYGVSLAALVAANEIPDASLIRPGQRLVIPRTATPPTSQPGPARQHRVAAGESLWSIARSYGVTVPAMVRANALANPSLIRVGLLLTVPTSSASTIGGGDPASPRMSSEMARLVASRAGIGRLIEAAALAEGVPPSLALALAWQESGWQQSAVSSAGAIGVMQITPPTADWIAASMLRAPVNLYEVNSNVRAGLRLIHHYLNRYGHRDLALAAYYQGQTGTDRHGIYVSSRRYVASILALEGLFTP